MNPQKRNLVVVSVTILAVVVVLSLLLSRGGRPDPTLRQEPLLRVAWMTSWATAGQVVEALIHTDILERNNVRAEFKSFLFGPPMNEAAITGAADVTIVGDMPAIILLSRSDKWSIVCRTIYFPYGLMVRSDLDLGAIADLRGKTIGVPFGSGPQPTLYRWLEQSGLTIGTDVTVINLLPNEMAEAIKSKRVDAIMTWEPTMTVLEQDQSVRPLQEAKGVGFMCVSNKFIEKHPDTVRRFVASWREALFYTAQHRDETDTWFAADSRFPSELLRSIRVVDENLGAARLEDVDVRLTTTDVAKNQQKADFAFDQNLLSRRLSVGERVRYDVTQ